ncbi:MAG: S26 family signal peptidase [Gemmataceae bacterium]
MADDNLPGSGQKSRPTPISVPPAWTPGDKPAPGNPADLNGVIPARQANSVGPVRRLMNFFYPKHEGAGQYTDGLREVVETVVFVVVLVLMLKSFAAEAFVIPTGSMAETLFGYQANVTCPECGYKFPVNFSSVVDPQDKMPQVVDGCTCPNCRLHIDLPKGLFKDADGLRDGPLDTKRALEIEIEKAETGDRVLVAKFWTKSFFGLGPDRFDTVVFKYPVNPQKDYTPQNYIKREIGLSGETIGIHRGKLYCLAPEEPPPFDDSKVAAEDLWHREYMHEDDQEMIKRLEHRKGFRILQKPTKTMLAEMRIVYDNDHPAKDMASFPRWAGEEGKTAWASAEGNSLHHALADQKDYDFIRYRHLLRDNPGKRQLITDFMGYNSGTLHDLRRDPPGQNWVSDLILECEVNVDQSSGDLVLELSKGPDRFQARWDLATGYCALVRVKNDGKEEQLDKHPTNLKKGNYRLRFANVDDRLVVWVDNKLPFGEKVNYEPIRDLSPNEKNDLEPASIGVRGAAVKVQHVKLWRDTYYTCRGRDPDVKVNDWSDPSDWSNLGNNMPYKTFYVQPGHYLCLGDNSPESSDGRSWGLVPERLMLGRALLVYWPFGRAGRIR